MQKVCIWCEKLFVARYAHRRYCSHRCYMAFKRASPYLQDHLLDKHRLQPADDSEDEEWTPSVRMVNGHIMPVSERGWTALAKETQEKLMRRPDAVIVHNRQEISHNQTSII